MSHFEHAMATVHHLIDGGERPVSLDGISTAERLRAMIVAWYAIEDGADVSIGGGTAEIEEEGVAGIQEDLVMSVNFPGTRFIFLRKEIAAFVGRFDASDNAGMPDLGDLVSHLRRVVNTMVN